jgi:cell division protein FtsB
MHARARIRWDRLGRLALLGVMGALVYLSLSAGLSLLSTWHEARRNSAQVVLLERQERQLRAQHAALGSRSALVAEARRLGMSRPGEVQYVVQGLPDN